MSTTRGCLLGLVFLVLGIVVGLAAGTVLGWWLWPVSYVDTEISDLRPGHQDDYILMIGDAYFLDGDLSEAQRRLSQLQEPSIGRRVAGLIVSKMAAGEAPEELRPLVSLAQALQVDTQDMLDYVATVTPTPTPSMTATDVPAVTPTSTATSTSTATPEPIDTEVATSPSLPVRPSATLRPATVPTATRAAPVEPPPVFPTETPYLGGWELSLTPPPAW